MVPCSPHPLPPRSATQLVSVVPCSPPPSHSATQSAGVCGAMPPSFLTVSQVQAGVCGTMLSHRPPHSATLPAGVCSTMLSHRPPHSATMPAGVCNAMPPPPPHSSQCHPTCWCRQYHDPHPLLTVPHSQLVSAHAGQPPGVCGTMLSPPPPSSQCHTASWCLQCHAPLLPHSATQPAGVDSTMIPNLSSQCSATQPADVCGTMLSPPPPSSQCHTVSWCLWCHAPLLPHSVTRPAGVCGTMPPTPSSQCHTASWCLWYHALPTHSLLTVSHGQLVSVVRCSPHPLPPHSVTLPAGVCGTMLSPPTPSSQCHTVSWCPQYVPCVTVPHSQLVYVVPCVTVPHSQLVYAVPCSWPLPPPPLPQVPHGQLANCGCEWPRTSGQKGLIRLNQGMVTPRRRQ